MNKNCAKDDTPVVMPTAEELDEIERDGAKLYAAELTRRLWNLVPKALALVLFGLLWVVATRVDRTDDDGQWTVSQVWLKDIEKILFCWPDGSFDCAVVRIQDSWPFPAVVEINLPEPIQGHRSQIGRSE